MNSAVSDSPTGTVPGAHTAARGAATFSSAREEERARARVSRGCARAFVRAPFDAMLEGLLAPLLERFLGQFPGELRWVGEGLLDAVEFRSRSRVATSKIVGRAREWDAETRPEVPSRRGPRVKFSDFGRRRRTRYVVVVVD